MKTLQSYLLGIKDNPRIGWSVAYSDILGKRLSDADKFLNGVDLFGEEMMFEAIIATSIQKLKTPDPLSYVLAVARQLWKEELQNSLTQDADELRLERAKRRISEGNAELADRIKEAKRRADANDPIF
jgi:hypothetical protein